LPLIASLWEALVKPFYLILKHYSGSSGGGRETRKKGIPWLGAISNTDRPGIEQGKIPKQKCLSFRCPDLEIIYLWTAGIKTSFVPAIHNRCYFQTASPMCKSCWPFIGPVAAVALDQYRHLRNFNANRGFVGGMYLIPLFSKEGFGEILYN
jgi:hypothetical protein